MTEQVTSARRGTPLLHRVEGLRGSRLGKAMLAAICGLGLAVSGVTLVRAADDAGVFDFFGSQRLQRIVDPLRLRPRYASEPSIVYRPAAEISRREARRQARLAEIRRAAPKRSATRRSADARLARPGFEDPSRPPVARRARVELGALGGAAAGRRTMCVRTCDGYLFPVGTLHSRSDLKLHETACSAACPGTETRLYTLSAGQQLENPSSARSVIDGSPYGRLKTAFLFRSRAVPSCDCQKPGVLASHLPILLDPTLRRGDVVVDKNGDAKAYAGGERLPRRPQAFAGYEGSRALSRSAKAQVDRLMGTSVRRKIAADYERSERRRLAALKPGAPVRDLAEVPNRRAFIRQAAFREVATPAGSGANVRAFSASPQGATRHPSGAQIITIQ